MTGPEGSQTSKKIVQYARALLPLILLASWPFVAFLANNRDQTLRASDVLIPWIAVVVCAVASALVATKLLRNRPINRIAIGFTTRNEHTNVSLRRYHVPRRLPRTNT